MIRLVEYTPEDYERVISLRVHDFQKEFVAANSESICDMENAENAEGYIILHDDVPVGFMTISFGRSDEDDPSFVDSSWAGIWRLMIDFHCQKRGYGREAARLVIDMLKRRGFSRIWLSCDKENTSAEHLYESLGFVGTGDMCCGETVLVTYL